MNREELRRLQTPLKERYQADPSAAIATLHCRGEVDLSLPGCRVALPVNDGQAIIAGLHPHAGGDGRSACSGEILLQALVTCAGTTLAAVAMAMELPIQSASIEAAGTMDFRGTLSVDRSAPVGLTGIVLRFDVTTSADQVHLQKLIQLTERYCVVYQTLRQSVPIVSHLAER